MSSASPGFAGVPRAGDDELGVYVMGGGVGESVVLDLPDRKLIVVDSCTVGGVNAPLALVRHLQRPVGLFMLSHPDLDHLRGVAELLEETKPGEVWRYPLHAAPRDALAKWAQNGNRPLFDALVAIEKHQKRTGTVFSVTHGQVWPGASSEYTLRAFAPTPYDQERLGKVWDRLIGPRPRGRARMDAYLERLAKGQARLGDVANILSIGAVLTWRCHKVILGGDVLVGSRSPFSGWKGIVALLDNRGPQDLLSDATVVKVAHHGSRHSFEALAWDRHGRSRKPVAVLAPFIPRLPDGATLEQLRGRVSTLGISRVDGATGSRVRAAGWRRCSSEEVGAPGGISCVGAILNQSGAVRAWAHGASGTYTTDLARG